MRSWTKTHPNTREQLLFGAFEKAAPEMHSSKPCRNHLLKPTVPIFRFILWSQQLSVKKSPFKSQVAAALEILWRVSCICSSTVSILSNNRFFVPCSANNFLEAQTNLQQLLRPCTCRQRSWESTDFKQLLCFKLLLFGIRGNSGAFCAWWNRKCSPSSEYIPTTVLPRLNSRVLQLSKSFSLSSSTNLSKTLQPNKAT